MAQVTLEELITEIKSGRQREKSDELAFLQLVVEEQKGFNFPDMDHVWRVASEGVQLAYTDVRNEKFNPQTKTLCDSASDTFSRRAVDIENFRVMSLAILKGVCIRGPYREQDVYDQQETIQICTDRQGNLFMLVATHKVSFLDTILGNGWVGADCVLESIEIKARTVDLLAAFERYNVDLKGCLDTLQSAHVRYRKHLADSQEKSAGQSMSLTKAMVAVS